MTPSTLVSIMQPQSSFEFLQPFTQTHAECDPREILVNNVSHETMDRLDSFAAHLEQWNQHINLVSRHSIGDMWKRHILDSAQLIKLLPQGARNLLDIGTGAGFPGLVLAILAAEYYPGLQVILMESHSRKVEFLKSTCRIIGIIPKIIHGRAELHPSVNADIITARAVAPLYELLALTYRHVTQNGLCLFLKGREIEEEINHARLQWKFSYSLVASITSDSGSILRLVGLRDAK